MMPERAADREFMDPDRNSGRRGQEQGIDPAGAAGPLPEPDPQRQRDPAGGAARSRRKTRTAKFYGARRGVAIGWRGTCLIFRAVKHAAPRARRRSPPRGSATTAHFAAPAAFRAR